MLKTESHVTWTALKEGDFCVRKTGVSFTNLICQSDTEAKKLLESKGGWWDYRNIIITRGMPVLHVGPC